jgi:hypothetical protein
MIQKDEYRKQMSHIFSIFFISSLFKLNTPPWFKDDMGFASVNYWHTASNLHTYKLCNIDTKNNSHRTSIYSCEL